MAHDPLARQDASLPAVPPVAPAFAAAPPAVAPPAVAPPPPPAPPPAPAPPTTGGEGPSPRASMFVSLQAREFRLLWIGTTAQGFSQWGQQIALNWLVFVLTGSAVQLGAVAFAGGILALILGPFAGLLADRYPRRTIMVTTNTIGAAQAIVIAALVVTDTVQVWHAYAFAVLSSLTSTVSSPAQQAYVHDVSTPETLTNAIALSSVAQNISRIVGPPLAGIIVAWNIGAAFALVAVARSLSALTAMALARRPHTPLPPRNPLREVFDGFRYLGGDSRLLLLLVMNSLPSMFIIPYLQFFPILASEVFHGGSREYGLLASMLAIGSIIGLLFLARAGDVRHKGWILIGGEFMYVTLVLLMTRMDIFIAALALLATAGVFHSVARALNTTLFQTYVRSDMRGRGMAAFHMGSGLMPVGALMMGFLVAHFGVQDGIALSQLMCFVGYVVITTIGRSLRNA